MKIFSFIFHKITEDAARQKKIRKPDKNFGNVGIMEEAVEEENN